MFAQRLRETRERAGLSQAELGERVGIEGRAVYRYEKGENSPSAEMVTKFARELIVSADYLLGLVDSPTDRVDENALTPDERRLIAASRSGTLDEAIEALLRLKKKVKSNGGDPGNVAIEG